MGGKAVVGTKGHVEDNAESAKHGIQLVRQVDDGCGGGADGILLGKGGGHHLALHKVVALGPGAGGGGQGTQGEDHEEWLKALSEIIGVNGAKSQV